MRRSQLTTVGISVLVVTAVAMIFEAEARRGNWRRPMGGGFRRRPWGVGLGGTGPGYGLGGFGIGYPLGFGYGYSYGWPYLGYGGFGVSDFNGGLGMYNPFVDGNTYYNRGIPNWNNKQNDHPSQDTTKLPTSTVKANN